MVFLLYAYATMHGQTQIKFTCYTYFICNKLLKKIYSGYHIKKKLESRNIVEGYIEGMKKILSKAP